MRLRGDEEAVDEGGREESRRKGWRSRANTHIEAIGIGLDEGVYAVVDFMSVYAPLLLDCSFHSSFHSTMNCNKQVNSVNHSRRGSRAVRPVSATFQQGNTSAARCGLPVALLPCYHGEEGHLFCIHVASERSDGRVPETTQHS
ncbi:hypothetical protein EYF80_043762 [Liparis tanakae]|uniref:Uncharacterized protein n=1 Tax=Liparis tanakae TaxID=230148 RepID=A0A4Z2FZF1_9TELE|nr:hypothetical protein EYF80_043762 [Liparis tanakae]